MKIKICGLTREEDIRAVNRYRPDYAGFVFAPGKRQITGETAALLKGLLSPDIQAVGVFVNAPAEEILCLAEKRIIDVIQLHGDETEEYAGFLTEHTPLPVIKAVRVKTTADILKVKSFPCSYVLLDAYAQGSYGGGGESFDWSLIPPLEKPYFLAGGLNAHNVKNALKTSACCLDFSSCVETDGKKDPEKIREMIEIIRSDGI